VLCSAVMQDTSPAAEKRYFELLRAQTPQQRLNIAVRLTEAVRNLARAGIVEAHPGASPKEVNARLAERLYGRATADRLFPGVIRDSSSTAGSSSHPTPGSSTTPQRGRGE
jgi:hypothetical protein